MLNWFKKLGIRNKLLLTYAAIVLEDTKAARVLTYTCGREGRAGSEVGGALPDPARCPKLTRPVRFR